MKKFILIILIWVGTFKLWSLLWNIYSADHLYIKSQQYLTKGDIEMANRLVDKAIEQNSNEPNYYRGKAKILIVKSGYSKDLVTEKSKDEILSVLEKSVELNPHNLVTLRNSIPLYYFLLAQEASVGAEYQEKYLNVVRGFYSKLKTDYVHDAGVVSAIAKYEKKLGLKSDYQESVEIIKKLRPDLLEWNDSFR